MRCPHNKLGDCIDCHLNATSCPKDSLLWAKDTACPVRAETGSCEHTTQIMDQFRARYVRPLTEDQKNLLLEIDGLAEQVMKGHYLNAHFRAFEIANKTWSEHKKV